MKEQENIKINIYEKEYSCCFKAVELIINCIITSHCVINQCFVNVLVEINKENSLKIQSLNLFLWVFHGWCVTVCLKQERVPATYYLNHAKQRNITLKTVYLFTHFGDNYTGFVVFHESPRLKMETQNH